MGFLITAGGSLLSRDGGEGPDPLEAPWSAIDRDAARTGCPASSVRTTFGNFVADRASPDTGLSRGCFVVSRDELEMLRTMSARDWLRPHDRTLITAGSIRVGRDFVLEIGPSAVPLHDVLPLDGAKPPFRVLVLRDRWRIEELLLLRPLVLIVGPSRRAGTTAASFRASDAEVAVRIVAGPDEEEAFLASAEAAEWQPILRLTPDVVADGATAPLFRALVLADAMCSVPLARDASSGTPGPGLTLVQEAGFDASRDARGFDPALLSIPNARHDAVISHRLALRLADRLRAGRDGGAMVWATEEAANYAARVRNVAVDLSTLPRFVGDHDEAEGRRGLLRFSATTDPAERVRRMLRQQEVARGPS